jgi:hypothetical protein
MDVIRYLTGSAALAASTMFSVAPASAQAHSPAPGCYVASRGLTYSATGDPEHGDTAWSHVRLSANGVARRPLLRNDVDRLSSWSVSGDSLSITFSDGLVGWRLQLTPANDGWSGTATYLADAIVRGESPYQAAIDLKRERCASA